MRFKRVLNDLFCRARNPRRRRYCNRVMPAVEALDPRVMLAVTASFSAGTLRVTGDDQDNLITISRNALGTILLNGGAIPILGDPNPNILSVHTTLVVGAGGDDHLTLDESNGPLPGAGLFGGDGNDVLTGGSGSDFVDGGVGNDMVFMGGGNDDFQWNPGNGSDIVDGGSGRDTMVFNGNDLAEQIGVGAAGGHVRFTRDLGGVSMDLDGMEVIQFNAFGGADMVTVDDQTATDLFDFDVNLSGPAGTGGDGQADLVVVNGTGGDDLGQVAAFNGGTLIGAFMSLFPFVNITGAEGVSDRLILNAGGGDDTVDAMSLPANLIGLSVNGGDGEDAIFGSSGNDMVSGGGGNDTALLGPGDDTFTWNAGDGADVVDGEAGTDTLNFTGSNSDERVGVSAVGGRVQVTRDADGVVMNVDGVEQVSLSVLGGADDVAVNDLTGTAVAHVKVKLNSDGRPDSVAVDGTNGADAIGVEGDFANGVTVSGLAAGVEVLGTIEPADSLRVNGNGGSDRIDVDFDAPLIVGVDGGAQQDTINVLRTGADGVVRVLPSGGDDALNVGGVGPELANVSFDATQRIGALSIGSGGAAAITPGDAKVLTVTSLDIAGTGRFNLSDGGLIVDYALASPIATIRSLLRLGFNGGAWNGPGLATDRGDASTFALGYGEASDVAAGGTFAGQAVDGTAVVVRLTRYGDANLDGAVGFADLVRMAQHFTSQGVTWPMGDFDYNGLTDFEDLVHLAQNYNSAPAAALPQAEFSLDAAASANEGNGRAEARRRHRPAALRPARRPASRRMV
jgi:Ca2+-binding RTX toxin-like protein